MVIFKKQQQQEGYRICLWSSLVILGQFHQPLGACSPAMNPCLLIVLICYAKLFYSTLYTLAYCKYTGAKAAHKMMMKLSSDA